MGDAGIGKEPFDIVLLNSNKVAHCHGESRKDHQDILPRHSLNGFPDRTVQRFPRTKDRIEETNQQGKARGFRRN